MRSKKWWRSVSFLAAATAAAASEEAGPCPRLGREWKMSIVNVDLSTPIGLARDVAESGSGTGFVVDAERGIVATNQHISTESPTSKINLFFNNGALAAAKVMYYDPWHDFAFLRYDPAAIRFKPKAVELGTIADVKEGDLLCLMGNSSSEQFSVKSGNVNRVFVSKATHGLGRASHQIHLSLARAGGASGSPVFTTRGKAVGIHTSGKENESFELRVDYLRDALRQLQRGATPRRGDLHASLFAVRVQRGPEHLGIDPRKYEPARDPGWPRRDMLLVNLTVPGSAAAEKLAIGDVVLGIRAAQETRYRMIGDDLYAFDAIVDGNVGGKVSLLLFRDGKEVEAELPVHDAAEGKIRRFAVFSGGVFHEVTPSLALDFNLPLRAGVFMAQSASGSPFEIGKLVEDTSNKRRVLIDKVGVAPIRGLDDFVREMRKIQKPSPSTLWLRDLLRDGIRSWAFIDADPTFDPLKVFRWNPGTLDWEEEKS